VPSLLHTKHSASLAVIPSPLPNARNAEPGSAATLCRSRRAQGLSAPKCVSRETLDRTRALIPLPRLGAYFADRAGRPKANRLGFYLLFRPHFLIPIPARTNRPEARLKADWVSPRRGACPAVLGNELSGRLAPLRYSRCCPQWRAFLQGGAVSFSKGEYMFPDPNAVPAA